MRTTTEAAFLDTTQLSRAELVDRRLELRRQSYALCQAIDQAGGDMGLLLEPAVVGEVQAAAKPLVGQPMFLRSQAIGYWLGANRPGEFTVNDEPGGKASWLISKGFTGILNGVEVVEDETVNVSSLCLVLSAFRRGKNGDYPYSSTSRICGQTNRYEPQQDRAWVPVAPTEGLGVRTRHIDRVVQAMNAATKRMADSYRVFAD